MATAVMMLSPMYADIFHCGSIVPMISATMPISDMKNPNSCIPEFAIVPSRKESNLFQIFSVLSSGKIYKLRWRWGGEWAELVPVMLLASGAPLSLTDMWDASDVTGGGCVIITTSHACRCGGQRGGSWWDGAPPLFSEATGCWPLSTFLLTWIKQLQGTSRAELKGETL